MINRIKNILKDQYYAISLYSRQVCGTIVLFIIAHYLSVYEYGLFTSYKSIAMFCLMFANMEFANYILVSSHAQEKAVRLKVSLFLLNAIFILLLIILFSLICRLEAHLLFILVVIRTFFDVVFFALILPYFQATKKFNAIANINIFYSLGVAIIAIFSYIFKLPLLYFLFLNIILGVINFVQCSFYVKINYFLTIKFLKRFISRLDKSIFGFIGSTITEYMYTQLSSLYVAIFLTKEEAALYFAAYTIASVPNLITVAQTQKMLPELLVNSINKRREILMKNIKRIFIILLFMLIFFVVFGKLILKLLYGQDYYTNTYPILILYLISNIFISNGAVHGVNITARGFQNKKVQMKLETACITLVCLLLLSKYNVYGAVISLLISSIYVSIRYSIFSYKVIDK